MLGWTVLSQLKHSPLTRHIPVQIVTLDEDRQHALARGAFSYVSKPATPEGVSAALSRLQEYAKPRRKRLLLVEDNTAEQLSIKALLDHSDIEIVVAETGEDALSVLRAKTCDCVVLDLRLPDMSGFEVLDYIRADEMLANVPVVVFTGRELSAEEDAELHTIARSIVVKGVESLSDFSMRPPFSSIVRSRNCPPTSKECLRSSMDLMRTWPEERRYWLTTTLATSSR